MGPIQCGPYVEGDYNTRRKCKQISLSRGAGRRQGYVKVPQLCRKGLVAQAHNLGPAFARFGTVKTHEHSTESSGKLECRLFERDVQILWSAIITPRSKG